MIEHHIPLELMRPPSGRCLGAVFSTYALDESFFETVLAALLPIHADPESDTRMFLAEARRRLRETPVVVLADGNSYAGGHRLPYHLLLSPRTVAWHARAALLLFEDHARLIVGSANLTSAGFGESADLCSVSSLDYKRDATLCKQVLDLFDSAGAEGEGWERFARQCRAMIPRGSSKSTNPVRLLASSAKASVLEQFLRSIPKTAKVLQTHLMAPTQPEDDARIGARALDPLRRWLTKRKSAELNLCVAWADASVAAPSVRQITEPEQLVGYLCAELQGPPGGESVQWSPALRVEKNKVYLQTRKQPLVRKAVASVMQSEPPRFWAVEEVTGVGLLEAIEPLSESLDVRWWLFPEVQLHLGNVRRRPFHAKLVAICTVENKKPVTHVLLGGLNFDRSASETERVFEVGLHLRLPRHLTITELCAELVPAPDEGFYLEDRSWRPAESKVETPLEKATYDAKSHLLTLDWQPRAPSCRVLYQRDAGEEELLNTRPKLQTTFPRFVLGHSSTEIRVIWDERQALVPVAVKNVSYLRADEPEEDLDLHGLVALHASQRRATVPGQSVNAQMIFHAQQTLAEMLASTGSQLGAFEVALDGPVGLRAFAEAMLRSEDCDRSEMWLFGLELCKLLRGIAWDKDPFAADKKRTIGAFVDDLHGRLQALTPKEPWSREVSNFYGGKGKRS